MAVHKKHIILAVIIALVVALSLLVNGFCWQGCSFFFPKITSSVLKKCDKIIPVAVIGSGPAGLTAALYTARAHLPTIVFAGPTMGGQLTEARSVENWPSKYKEPGLRIMNELESQVRQFNASISPMSVKQANFSAWPYRLELEDDTCVQALSVVIATGGSQMTTDIPGVKEYWGKGIGICTICDAPFDKGKVVVVMGDSDIACDMVLQLKEFAQHVYLCAPHEHMAAAAVNQEYLQKATNVSILINTDVQRITGDGKQLTGVVLKDRTTGEVKQLPIESFYFALGFKPDTALVKDQVALDSQGYITVNARRQTSKPLVYAAGTVIDPIYQKGLISASMGAEAAISLIQDIQDAGFAQKMLDTMQDRLYQVPVEPYHIEAVNSPKELANILQQHEIVLVNFYGLNCPACQQALPILQKVGQEMEGVIKVVNFNIQEMYDIIDIFQLTYKPTLILFKKGKERERTAGLLTRDELIEFVNENK